MTKKKILYTLFFILVLVVLCYATFTFHKLRDRQSASVQIPDYVKHELIDETMGETPEEIAESCSELTGELLQFSFDQTPLFQGGVSRAHCVTYAKVCAELCNIAYKQYGIQAHARPVVGEYSMLGINLHKVAQALLPAKYDPLFKDHDVVEVQYGGKTIYIDPSLDDILD